VVTQNSSAQADALSAFATAYNSAVDELTTNRGEGGGALVGDPIISTLAQALRSLEGFSSGSGPVQSLADLGLTIDKTGKLSFSQSTFETVSAAHPTDVAAFLGSTATSGFLKNAADALNGLEDPSSGVIKTTRDGAQTAIDRQNRRIADEQSRIDALTRDLTGRMAAADALIASLEQQVNYFSTLFASMNGTQNK
jgi:flagellar hook-associated protein 2